MEKCSCENLFSPNSSKTGMAKRKRMAVKFQDKGATDFFKYPVDGRIVKPVQRNTANARERARMRILSKAFFRLKGKLPFVPQDTKLSKLDTLRLASTYIAHLRKILREDGVEGEYPVLQSGNRNEALHPINLTWPFTINSRSVYNECSSTSSTAEHNQCSDDFSHDAITEYRNFMPCEYLAMNQSVYHRTDADQQYFQQ